jgi:hypothetical protein
LEDFDIYGAEERVQEWTIELREKEERIPSSLRGCVDVVFDGYCDPIHILSHIITGIATTSVITNPIKPQGRGILKFYTKRMKQQERFPVHSRFMFSIRKISANK